MHGKNEVRPVEIGDGTHLQIREVWYTIQGEGPFVGCPAIFIRLTGCNLRCHFCDTVWDDDKDPYMHHKDIVQKVLNLRELHAGCSLVVLTGGEPMRQNLSKLLSELDRSDFDVQIETAGTYWQPCVSEDRYVTLVCSPKTAHVHPKIMEWCKNWKYVIRKGEVDGTDGLPAYPTQVIDPLVILNTPVDSLEAFKAEMDKLAPYQTKYGAPARPPERRDVTVWLSPCDEGDPAKTQENIQLVGALCLEFGYRAQIQLHKAMNLP